MNHLMILIINILIRILQIKNFFIKSEKWIPGQPLKLLLIGHTGMSNVGTDVRIEELVRQLNTIFQDRPIDFTIITPGDDFAKGSFLGVTQKKIDCFFPYFLYKTCPKYHGVIACEGSMFKSSWDERLSIFMIGCLGFANVENKLSVGYGGEVGEMSLSLRFFLKLHCRKSLIITRSKSSQNKLHSLNMPSKLGSDTAWTFQSEKIKEGQQLLKNKGWDGKKKILIVCPVNPFWWPIKPSVIKY